MAKIKLSIVLHLNDDTMREHGKTAQDVIDNLYCYADDVVDGFVITTDFEEIDHCSAFFLEAFSGIESSIVD